MKTADEWMNELPLHPDRSFIRAIRLDAYKAGMSEAIEILAQHNFGGFAATKQICAIDIMEARDNKTIL